MTPYVLTVRPAGPNTEIYFALPEGEYLSEQAVGWIKLMASAWCAIDPPGSIEPSGHSGFMFATNEKAAEAEAFVRKWIEHDRASTLQDPPRAHPRTVCGVKLDEWESAHFEEAYERGELVIELHRPASSRTEAAWKAYCAMEGIPCRIRREQP